MKVSQHVSKYVEFKRHLIAQNEKFAGLNAFIGYNTHLVQIGLRAPSMSYVFSD